MTTSDLHPDRGRKFHHIPGRYRAGRALRPGDWVVIPAHCQHRVAWTDPAAETLWLAVHLPPA